MSKTDRNAWETAIREEICRRLGCDYGDADGVTDAQPFTLAQQWALNSDAITAAAAIIKAGSSHV